MSEFERLRRCGPRAAPRGARISPTSLGAYQGCGTCDQDCDDVQCREGDHDRAAVLRQCRRGADDCSHESDVLAREGGGHARESSRRHHHRARRGPERTDATHPHAPRDFQVVRQVREKCAASRGRALYRTGPRPRHARYGRPWAREHIHHPQDARKSSSGCSHHHATGLTRDS